MALLDSHLKQIKLSSNAISELLFPPPRIFTNALLGPHDITALIRDTEAHERALFQLHPSANSAYSLQMRSTRRGTQFQPETEEPVAGRIDSARSNRNQSAVSKVLGPDMMEEIKRSAGTSSRHASAEVNIEVLLRGAEILCDVYPVPGAQEQIASLRNRHQLISKSLAQLEDRVATNTSELERIRHSYRGNYDDYDTGCVLQFDTIDITHDDVQRELDEIKDLEQRRRILEDRVSEMERDLGGLMR